ncbi:hypothetical protein HDV01_001487, partial [Terramyces sp. JEL0728]
MSNNIKNKTVLVTGFGPFGTVDINPSWEAVKTLPNSIDGFEIKKVLVPVSYKHVSTTVPTLIAELNPSLVIHFGVGRPGAIRLEKNAHNNMYGEKDANGELPEGGMCIRADDAILRNSTLLNVDHVLTQMKAQGYEHIQSSIGAG